MVHQYIADTLVTPSQPTVGRYLDTQVTDDRPMRGLYNNRYSTATRSLYQPIYQRTVDRGDNHYISVDTHYKKQDPTTLLKQSNPTY